MESLRKKIKNLFEVNYNKSAKLCNPCGDARKKVNNKVNGRKLSKKLLLDLKDKIKNDNIEPLFKCILIGNNPASRIYIKIKKQKCDMIGIKFILLLCDPRVSEEKANNNINFIKKLNIYILYNV